VEVKSKEKLQVSGSYGIIKNVKANYQRITCKFSLKASGVAVLSHPYKISKAHKAQVLEVERNKSQASAHAQRMRAHIIWILERGIYNEF
jgi:hypothetical protein